MLRRSTSGFPSREQEMMLRRSTSASAAVQSGYRPWEPVGACTESLGSESGDVGGDAEIDQLSAAAAAAGDATRAERDELTAVAGLAEAHISSPEKRRRTERRLPPAMPRRSAEAFMRAERRDGRLILTEVVRLDRPREVFRASRAYGRLLLRFAVDSDGGEVEAAREPPETESSEENEVLAAGCSSRVGIDQAMPGAGACVDLVAVLGI